jgi:hypothetical protein
LDQKLLNFKIVKKNFLNKDKLSIENHDLVHQSNANENHTGLFMNLANRDTDAILSKIGVETISCFSSVHYVQGTAS